MNHERKIICKITTGSHLYGTNRPDSDIDYTGVFLPSRHDLLGLQNPPAEFSQGKKESTGTRNTAGDVDEKYFNVKRFLQLAAEGQPGQLEMLFAPKHCLIESTPEWQKILENRHLLLSQKGIQPFIGFALAQAHKATIKGENLRNLRELQIWGMKISNTDKNAPLRNHIVPLGTTGKATIGTLDLKLDYKLNDHNFLTLTVAGRQYDPGSKTSNFLNGIESLIQKYGTRSAAAAADGHDFKSLMHTYRLLDEAEEFLLAGVISLPRPPAQIKRLLEIRNGKTESEKFDWFDDIMEKVDHLRDHVLPLSTLPKEVKWSKIDRLCENILMEHLTPKKSFLRRLKDLL